MKDFDFQQYRKDLAKEIVSQPDKPKRREILKRAKKTPEYAEARSLRMKQIDQLVENAEELSAARERLGVKEKPSEIVSARQAVREL